MNDQSGIDPRTAQQEEPFPEQQQDLQPGVTGEMSPRPDHGEESWQGRGRLRGRKALITGGDSGIGRAVAIAFAREGADVAIGFLPEEREDAEVTRDLVDAAGQRCLLLPGDLRDEQACIDTIRDVREGFGGIDLLVVNAAYQKQRDGIDQIETSEIERTFHTNLVSMMVLVREAVPHLPEGSSIIVTSSVQAASPSHGLVEYAMTKSAQVAFMQAMAEELGPQGIRVNAVAPGPIWTPLIPATGFPDDKVAEFGQDTPLGRAGQPAELAGAYVYLASDEATYTSGAVLPVTGGRPF
ncbi:SDR family oxidoreductase [Microbacterium amylolyticum]|uniref:NAD(P)-dependent dehydrogenase (Short-subunit alcohol dehydrogenase family) n=1 Tax=Microbacterium amylolyticum TaxID=936337 RepID=A0ABS4ZHR9_9MICO|nr:SDR family oxidoreductase [Microbacterium amylolyticum]MBP2436820.1 NAD(P)-dependent dehydrogenase (short-subunit alcohol dehydrogenase family) [Microbacterium amylolyticum]